MGYLAIVLFLLSCLPASSAEWTVDMTTKILDQDGKPIKDQYFREANDPECEKCPPFTLGEACAHALFLVGTDEKDVTPEQKWAWAVFAESLRGKKDAKLTSAQSDLLVKRLGRMYGGVVLMQAIPLIDPNRKPPEIK